MKHPNSYKQLFEVTKAHHSTMSAYVIDIGARDIATSNVRPFIEHDFKAMLIEPNPHQVNTINDEMFNDFTEYANNIKFIPVAIGEESKEVDFIASPNIGHSRIPNENFDRNKWQTKGQYKTKVMMYPLQIILNSHREFEDASVVDIDTEGYDTIVLKSLFESVCRPEFIMIEDWDDKEIIEEQSKLFKDNHYVLFSDKINQSKIYKKVL